MAWATLLPGGDPADGPFDSTPSGGRPLENPTVLKNSLTLPSIARYTASGPPSGAGRNQPASALSLAYRVRRPDLPPLVHPQIH
jgi:hypothetical protein